MFQATDTFGELAMLKNSSGRRKATVRSEYYTEVAVLSSDYYMQCMQKIDSRRINKMVDFI